MIAASAAISAVLDPCSEPSNALFETAVQWTHREPWRAIVGLLDMSSRLRNGQNRGIPSSLVCHLIGGCGGHIWRAKSRDLKHGSHDQHDDLRQGCRRWRVCCCGTQAQYLSQH